MNLIKYIVNLVKHRERFSQSISSLTKRSSHQRCSVKKVFLKILQNSSGKQMCWSHFLTKLDDVKRYSITDVFLRFLLISHTLFTEYFLVVTSKKFQKSYAQTTSEQLPLHFSLLLHFQKHLPGGFLQNRCYSKFRKTYMKTAVSKSFF